MARRRPRIVVQASGWPGSGRDTASCRRAGRRLVEEQPGEGLGDRDGRVAEPEADLAVLAATASPSVSRRTRDSGRPCSSIKLAAARSSSFVPSPVARRRSRAGQALQGCRSSPSSWPGRFVPAGPQRQQGRQAGHRGCSVTPRSRRGISRPWPAQDPGDRHPGFGRGEDQAGACSPGSGKASQAQGRGQEESVGVSHRPGAGLPSGSRRRHHRGIDAAPGRAPRAHRATERHRPATGDGSLPWAASPGSPRAAHPAQPPSPAGPTSQHPRPADREPAG